MKVCHPWKTTALILGVLSSTACSLAVETPPSAPARIESEVPDDLQLICAPYPGTRAEFLKAESTGTNIVADPDWFVWGGSVIEDGGKYHLFAERWPMEYGFNCWLTHAEIAQYVADRPEGPFRYVKTVLAGRGKGHWDQITAQNPRLCKFNGKFYLYYVSLNHPTLDAAGLIQTAKEAAKGTNWLPLRNSQRVGLAVAESLDGPWQRFDKPAVEPAEAIRRIANNPAVCQGPDGRYFMIIKGDKPASQGWTVIQAVAVADQPEGPWQIQPTPAFNDYNTEDACIWYDANRRRFYAVVHVHAQPFMAMITSTDGIQWEKAAQFKLMPKLIPLADGTSVKPSRMERPFVLTDARGNPQRIYLGILSGDGKRAFNLTLGLESAKAATAPAPQN